MRRLAPLAVALTLVVVSSCSNSSESEPAPAIPPKKTLDFGIYWPPQDPGDPAGPIGEPLLRGKLSLWETTLDSFKLTIELARPADEEHREIWNNRLAYREYDWMGRVRVWDADKKWLWPNVPYLLRAHGRNRVERYGGVDPGKDADNDFAAVLIRAYDETGQVELVATQGAPLVSAEWHPVGMDNVDRQSIVHTARSDEFTLPLGSLEVQQCRLGVWLIYADFMGSPSPETWPKKLEWAGGILAYFEIDWNTNANGKCYLSMEQKTPPSDTGFDWEEWIGPHDGDEQERAVARLAW